MVPNRAGAKLMTRQQFRAFGHFLALVEFAVQIHRRVLCPLQPEVFKHFPVQGLGPCSWKCYIS